MEPLANCEGTNVRLIRAQNLIPHEVVSEVLRRLALNAKGVPGHSIRGIAREVAVARNTVRAIKRRKGRFSTLLDSLTGYQRCKCGNMVLMPCRICAARSAVAA